MPIRLFVTCLADTFYPQVPRAMVRLLERLGQTWTCPADQTCCGQPLFNSGHFEPARRAARHFISVFEQTDGDVVCPSASCAAMVRSHYVKLFADDPAWQARAQALARRTFEWSEYLVRVLRVDLRSLGAKFSDSVTYHYSCHLRNLGVGDEPVRLLEQIEGIEYKPLNRMDQCCGFGGTFSVKFPHLSGTLARQKVQAVLDTGARWLIFSDAGCALNLGGTAHRQGQTFGMMHLAELLARSLGV